MSRLVKPIPTRFSLLAALAAIAALLLPAVASAAGRTLADNGFRPIPNGFSFENYGDEEGYQDLTPAEMERIYGPGVCLPGHGRCVLTPVARKKMIADNQGMAEGHCFGFATLSELIYRNWLPRFGYRRLAALGDGAKVPHELKIEHNRLLQRTIGRAMALQDTTTFEENLVEGTPKDVLETLLDGGLQPRGKDILTFLIFQPGFEDGHAITPYAVEDQGNGVYAVRVYDNNWPGDEDRRLLIDTKKNVWLYYASVNPGVPGETYAGTAKTKTLLLAPVKPLLGVQDCPFCIGARGGGSKYNEIRLDGDSAEHGKMVVEDEMGRKTGFYRGRYVNQIPGARVLPRTSGRATAMRKSGALYTDSPAPVIRVPKNDELEIRILGHRLKGVDRETLSLVGPTYDATVDNIVMARGQVARIALSPHGNALFYRSSKRTEVPAIALGAHSRKVAYNVNVAAVGAPPGAGLNFVRVPKRKLMWVGDTTKKRRTYRLTIQRTDAKGIKKLRRFFTIRGRQQAYLYYGDLESRGGNAKLVVYSPGRHKHRVRVLPVVREVE